MVRATGAAGERVAHVIDVFNDGAVRGIIQETDMDPRLLRPPAAKDVVFRILNNLRYMFEEMGNADKDKCPFELLVKYPLQFAVSSAMITLQPTLFEFREERFKLATWVGYLTDAVEDMKWVSLDAAKRKNKPAVMDADMEEEMRRSVESMVDCSEFSRESVQKNEALCVSNRERREGILPIGTVVDRQTEQGELFRSVILDTFKMETKEKEYRFCPLGFVNRQVVPIVLGHVGPSDSKVVTPATLPEEVLRSRDHTLVLGNWFESFDARLGVFVPDAYHRWVHGIDGDGGDESIATMDTEER